MADGDDGHDSWDLLLQSDDEEPERVQALPAKRETRGRKKGTFGNSILREYMKAMEPLADPELPRQSTPGTIEFARKHRAQNALERREQQEVARQEGQLFSVSDAAFPALSQYGPMGVFNSSACSVHEDMCRGLVQCHHQNIPEQDSLVDHQLQDAMSTVSASALAKQLGIPDSSIISRVYSISSACLEFSCYLWAVFFGTLASFWKTSVIGMQPLLCLIRLRYDETPTKVRVEDPKSRDLDLSKATMVEAAKSNQLGNETSCLHAKIMQVEMVFGILVKHQGPNSGPSQYTWIRGEIPTCLQAVESTTAVNTMHCLQNVLESIPNLKPFVQESGFQFRLRHSCSDRYVSNTAAEKGGSVASMTTCTSFTPFATFIVCTQWPKHPCKFLKTMWVEYWHWG